MVLSCGVSRVQCGRLQWTIGGRFEQSRVRAIGVARGRSIGDIKIDVAITASLLMLGGLRRSVMLSMSETNF